MTLNDVMVHARHFIITLLKVYGYSCFPEPYGFLDMPDSSVGFSVCNVRLLLVYGTVFSCRVGCMIYCCELSICTRLLVWCRPLSGKYSLNINKLELLI